MTDLEKLLMVAQAGYDQQRQAFVKIVQRENALRAELARISGLDQTSRLPEHGLKEMQAIGADSLWRAWLGRAKISLNQELARTLARKGQEQAQVRRAFGKVEALQTLINADKTKNSKRKAQAILALAMASALQVGLTDQ